MKVLLDVRLLATEYSTGKTQEGQIDSLARRLSSHAQRFCLITKMLNIAANINPRSAIGRYAM